VARAEDGRATQLERFHRKPMATYRRLAALPWIWPAIRRDDRFEHFATKPRPQGIWRIEALQGDRAAFP